MPNSKWRHISTLREYLILNVTHLDGLPQGLPLVLGATTGILLTPVVTTGLLGAIGFGALGPISAVLALAWPGSQGFGLAFLGFGFTKP